jgi:hypothetical protein
MTLEVTNMCRCKYISESQHVCPDLSTCELEAILPRYCSHCSGQCIYWNCLPNRTCRPHGAPDHSRTWLQEYKTLIPQPNQNCHSCGDVWFSWHNFFSRLFRKISGKMGVFQYPELWALQCWRPRLYRVLFTIAGVEWRIILLNISISKLHC